MSSEMSTYQEIRRATVGRSALGWLALTCLILNALWWLSVLGLLLNINPLANPRSLFTSQAIQALLLSVALAGVLPLFWSMLLPSSPAGQLLQKTQWRTIGFYAVLVGAIFLTYLAYRYILSWWLAQPNVQEAGEAGSLSLASLIASVLVPALAWAVVTPDQLIAQLQQARYVKWIERNMQLEEATARAMHARALAILSNGIANATIDERHELAGIMLTFYRQQQRALQGVADTFANMHGVEMKLSLKSDDEIAEKYKDVVRVLDDATDTLSGTMETIERESHHVNSRLQSYIPAQDESRAIVPVQNSNTMSSSERENVQNDNHVNSRLQSSIPRVEEPQAIVPVNHVNSRLQSYIPAQDESKDSDPSLTYQGPPTEGSVIDHDGLIREYVVAREKLDILTKKKLATLMEYSEQTAERRIKAWTECGWIEEINLGRHKFVYEGSANDE